MSMLPIEPDTERHCFVPCPPGTFCECQGVWIPDPDRQNMAVSDEDRRHTDTREWTPHKDYTGEDMPEGVFRDPPSHLPAVLIPQHPTRMGENGPERMAMDLTDAERYGRVCELLEPTAKPFDPDSIEQMDQALLESSEDDWLLCIGNPTLIAAAAGAFASIHGRLNVLQWQSRKGHYEAIQIIYTEDGTSLSVVTVPPTPGEDDDRDPR